METKLYLLTDDKAKFCLKQLKSFKTSRWLSPLVFLFINYFFITVMFPTNNRVHFLLIYMIFCIVTTTVVFFITSSAIKRYGNIVTKIKIADNAGLELNTLADDTIVIGHKDITVKHDLLSINRNNKFNVLIIEFNDKNFSLVPEWFNEQKELEFFFNI